MFSLYISPSYPVICLWLSLLAAVSTSPITCCSVEWPLLDPNCSLARTFFRLCQGLSFSSGYLLLLLPCKYCIGLLSILSAFWRFHNPGAFSSNVPRCCSHFLYACSFVPLELSCLTCLLSFCHSRVLFSELSS